MPGQELTPHYRQKLEDKLAEFRSVSAELRDMMGKLLLNWTWLSSHDFVDNQVRVQLFALTYNLGNFLRRLVLPKPVRKWSLRTLREKLIKIGAKVVKHSRYVVFQTVEVVVPRTLFREILDRIGRLRSSPELVGVG